MLIGKGKLIKFKNGKKLGVVCKDKTFRTFRNEKKHFFRLYNGWALNETLLKELKDVGVEWVEVHTKDYVYRTTLDRFFEVGIAYKNPKNERDVQLVLPLEFWWKYPALNKKKLKKVRKLSEF